MGLTISQWKERDRRASRRAILHLRLAVVYPQQPGRPAPPIYHGTSVDVCMSGLSMVAEENVFHEGEVTLLLALPPVHDWAAQKIITAVAEMTYAIRSSKLNGFKIGMRFLEFKEDARELLQAAVRHAVQQSDDADARDPGLSARAILPVDTQLLGA